MYGKTMASVFFLLGFFFLSALGSVVEASECVSARERADESCSQEAPFVVESLNPSEDSYSYAYKAAHQIYSQVEVIGEQCRRAVFNCAQACMRAALVLESVLAASPQALKFREFEAACKNGGAVYEKHKVVEATQIQAADLLKRAEHNYVLTHPEAYLFRIPAAVVPQVKKIQAYDELVFDADVYSPQVERALEYVK